jgi:tetratricopeptide (TPR) repeat protein
MACGIEVERGGAFGLKLPPTMTPEQRLAAVRAQLEKRPDDPFARYALAMGLRSAGDLDGAVREFRDLLARSPDYVPTYLMLGQILEQQAQDADALGAYERGVAAARRKGDGHAERELSGAAELLRARGTRGTIA